MYLGWTPQRSEVIDFVDVASKRGPASGGKFYQNFYTNQILREFGGESWAKYNAAMRSQLLAAQEQEGPAKGSWFIDGQGWSNRQGGRLFCTAMAALILETYYRHPPLYQDSQP
jgi:hypothetical protein